jgi:phage terminase small subunit
MQELFCENYVNNGFDGARAAIAAGYSVSRAHVAAYELLHSRTVKLYLRKHISRAKSKMSISIEYLMDKLKYIIEHNLDEDPRVVISAISEVSKIDGLYAAEKRVNTNVNIELDADMKEVQEALKIALEEQKRQY